jgi:site-specific DNA recombinase
LTDPFETAKSLLYELRRKHGIEVIFANMPNTGTYLDPAFEAIFQAFDYIHSQQSKVKGLASMKQNVKNGYRAGGKAPYGYALEQIELGKNLNGEPIVKTRLVPNPTTSVIAREYFERRVELESRKSILDDFYRRGIPSPTGKKSWPVATAKSMEENIEVYLGHTVFCRHNERVKNRGRCDGYLGGVKWRPRNEWVVCEHTHTPLISEETANRIKKLKENGLRDAPYNKKHYALSGIIKCGLCGINYTGDNGIYRCNSKTKPGFACPNNGISQDQLEQAVFLLIDRKVLNFNDVQAAITRIRKGINKGKPSLEPIEKHFKQIKKERQRLIDLFRSGLIERDEVERELTILNEQKRAVIANMVAAKSSSGLVDISDDEIKRIIENLAEEIRKADSKRKKRIVQTLFEEIKIFPKKGDPWERTLEIRGVYLPLTGVFVASPRGFEPLLPT